MRHYNLKTLQMTKAGFTDLFVIPASDFVGSTTDDLLLNIALCTLNLGDVVFDKTVIEIATVLAPVPSANATVTVSVGRTSSGYTDCCAAFTVINAGTAVAVKTSSAAGAAIGNQVIAADSTVLYAQVDINDADGDLATVTSGEIRIWACISRQSDRNGVA